MSRAAFHHLRVVLDSELDAFTRRLNALRARSYPTPVAHQLIHELLGVIESQRAALKQTAATFSADEYGAYESLRYERRRLSFNLAYLKWLTGAETQQVPWSFVGTIERFARQLTPGRKILTSATLTSIYRIDYEPAPSDSGLDQFDIIEIPRLARINALSHVLIMHELFHPIAHGFGTGIETRVSAELVEPCRRWRESRKDERPLIELIRLDQVVKNAFQFWDRALREIICDMGCAAVFGPAALFALWYLASTFDLDEVPIEPDWYPPFRYRLRIMLRYAFGQEKAVRALGDMAARIRPKFPAHVDALTAVMEELKQDCEVDSDTLALQATPLAHIAYTQLDRDLADAWSFVEQTVTTSNLSWTTRVAEVVVHLRNFRMLVPSGEVRTDPEEIVGTAADPVSIAIAAWLDVISSRRDEATHADFEAVHALPRFHRMCRLLLKSWEDSELKTVIAEDPITKQGNT